SSGRLLSIPEVARTNSFAISSIAYGEPEGHGRWPDRDWLCARPAPGRGARVSRSDARAAPGGEGPAAGAGLTREARGGAALVSGRQPHPEALAAQRRVHSVRAPARALAQ